MNMKKDLSTEQKIKEAAKEVFMTKGFAGCSSREIAKAAGMNVALLNYYFRSKGQLFEMIFITAMEDFMNSMVEVFSTEQPLEMKMRIFIEKEYEFLSKHPDLPAFVLNEINREDGCSMHQSAIFDKVLQTGIFEECRIAQLNGQMRKLDLINIMLLIMSNCQYPFMAKNLMKNLHNMSNEDYAQHILLHKQYVTEMLVNYLFLKN